MQMLNNFVFRTPMTGPTMAIVCILLPILIALLAVLGMKSSLYSVLSQKAAGYIAGAGLHLTRKTDTYIRTSTEVKQTNSGNGGTSGGAAVRPAGGSNRPAGNVDAKKQKSRASPNAESSCLESGIYMSMKYYIFVVLKMQSHQ